MMAAAVRVKIFNNNSLLRKFILSPHKNISSISTGSQQWRQCSFNKIPVDELSWLKTMSKKTMRCIRKEKRILDKAFSKNEFSHLQKQIESQLMKLEQDSVPMTQCPQVFVESLTGSDTLPLTLITDRDIGRILGRMGLKGTDVVKCSISGNNVCIVFEDNDNMRGRYILIIDTVHWRFIGHIYNVFNTELLTSKCLLYTRLDDKLRSLNVYVHTVGTDQCRDQLLYHETDDRFFVDLSRSKDGACVLINCNSKTSSEVWDVFASTEDDGSSLSVRSIAGRREGLEYYVEHYKDMFVILTHDSVNEDFHDYKVVLCPTADPSVENWRELYRPSNQSKIIDLVVHQQYCIVAEKSFKGRLNLTIIDLLCGSVEHKLLRHDACCVDFGAEVDLSDTTQLSLSSVILPEISYQFDIKTHTLQLAPDQNPAGIDTDEKMIMKQILVPSKDDVKVPLTIFHRRDITLDGGNPLLCFVYGAYGTDLDLSFHTERQWLLEDGWILAYCHIRGGGECGRLWYHSGRQDKKPNCFMDFESCVSYLHSHLYSCEELTAVYACSAGGMIAGHLINTRPQLIKAAVLKAPYLDVLCTMSDRELPLTTEEVLEWGDPLSCDEALNRMKQYCPYHNLSDQASPHTDIYMVSAMNDQRLPYWIPLRYAMKRRKLEDSGNSNLPRTLLDLNLDSGHLSDVTMHQVSKEIAFLYSSLNISIKND